MIRQTTQTLCTIILRLNALSASINRTASQSSSSNFELNTWSIASKTTFWPPQSCKGPTLSWICLLNVRITTVPIILRNTTPTPIGLRPGFKLSGTSLQDKKASRDLSSLTFLSIQSFLVFLSYSITQVLSASSKRCQNAFPVISVKVGRSRQGPSLVIFLISVPSIESYT